MRALTAQAQKEELKAALDATMPFLRRFSGHIFNHFGIVPAELSKAITDAERLLSGDGKE